MALSLLSICCFERNADTESSLQLILNALELRAPNVDFKAQNFLHFRRVTRF